MVKGRTRASSASGGRRGRARQTAAQHRHWSNPGHARTGRSATSALLARPAGPRQSPPRSSSPTGRPSPVWLHGCAAHRKAFDLGGAAQSTASEDACCSKAVSGWAAIHDPMPLADHLVEPGPPTHDFGVGRGGSERAIMNQTGDRRRSMVGRYIREGGLFRDDSAGGGAGRCPSRPQTWNRAWNRSSARPGRPALPGHPTLGLRLESHRFWRQRRRAIAGAVDRGSMPDGV